MGDGNTTSLGRSRNPAFPVLIGRTYRKIDLRIKMRKHEVQASARASASSVLPTIITTTRLLLDSC